jgi:hypothetical protein
MMMAAAASSLHLSALLPFPPDLVRRRQRRPPRFSALRFSHPPSQPLRIMADGDPIRKWILEEGGASIITRISSVGGGCINTANRYETDVGSFFVKTNRNIGPEMFEAEAAGLDAMFSTDTIRVPKPWKVGLIPRTRGSYIIMEYIEIGSSRGSQVTIVLGFYSSEIVLCTLPRQNLCSIFWISLLKQRVACDLSVDRCVKECSSFLSPVMNQIVLLSFLI